MLYVALIGLVIFLVLGRAAMRGDDQEKLFFVGNIVLGWGLSFAVFGFPGLIIPALFMVGLMFVILIGLTTAR